MTTRGVPWDRLDNLVPDELDEYWQLTLKFLQIAIKQWPDVLRERSVIEPVTRRDLLIQAEAARLARKTDAPVIAAGSTGSIPATAELIAIGDGVPATIKDLMLMRGHPTRRGFLRRGADAIATPPARWERPSQRAPSLPPPHSALQRSKPQWQRSKWPIRSSRWTATR